MKKHNLWLDGKATPGSAGEYFAVINPATGEEFAQVASATPDDARAACDAAAQAQRAWAARAPRERGEVLTAVREKLLAHTEEVAALITRENGKPLADARGEVAYSAEFLRWNAEEAVRIRGEMRSSPSGANRILVRHAPIGVVLLVTPWNFPLAMVMRKAAPALAAGNAVVLKPAAETPLTALYCAELFESAGLPPGLLNVAPAQNPGAFFDAAAEHRAVRMVSFTGSTEVGRGILARSAQRVLKVAMELGGNAPFIVFADADLDLAVEGAMVAKMRHSAQTCTAANRFFVEASVASAFSEKLTAAMQKIKLGEGTQRDVTCGPLINAKAVQRVDALVRGACEAGAQCLTGGKPAARAGFFYEPTVLAGVTVDSHIAGAEIFGPVAPVISFDDAGAMLAAVNESELGLAGYVFTRDLALGLRTSEQLECGMVGLNRGALSDPAAPFGGMKQSGIGREGASEGIYEFCETQYIAADW